MELLFAQADALRQERAEEADDVIEAPPEEARRARGLMDSGTPTKQHAEEHGLTHLSTWCPD